MVSRRPGEPKFELGNVALASAEAKKTRCFENAPKNKKKVKKRKTDKGGKEKTKKKTQKQEQTKNEKSGEKRGNGKEKMEKRKKEDKQKRSREGRAEHPFAKPTIYKYSRSSAPVAAVMLSSK